MDFNFGTPKTNTRRNNTSPTIHVNPSSEKQLGIVVSKGVIEVVDTLDYETTQHGTFKKFAGNQYFLFDPTNTQRLLFTVVSKERLEELSTEYNLTAIRVGKTGKSNNQNTWKFITHHLAVDTPEGDVTLYVHSTEVDKVYELTLFENDEQEDVSEETTTEDLSDNQDTQTQKYDVFETASQEDTDPFSVF